MSEQASVSSFFCFSIVVFIVALCARFFYSSVFAPEIEVI